ncbi:sensor histidine kinase [Candidatus Parcubacteria bacterium]|nr:sensor histidine kinase [Candidatus Parcubacteria bacterium]
MKPYAKSKEVVLEKSVKGELYINGSKANLKRLLINLIHNAIDYNKPRGKATVSLRASGNQIELKIVDTGIGIKKEDLKNIFDRFYKADQARIKQSGGAGLGLSIVKEIVELYNGTIEIKSETNVGTEITVMLPLVYS